jgi:hypothetical protein
LENKCGAMARAELEEIGPLKLNGGMLKLAQILTSFFRMLHSLICKRLYKKGPQLKLDALKLNMQQRK